MYDYPVTTPANTTDVNPLRTQIAIVAGVIDLVHVAFPPGPQGLLHVRIERGGSPLWPRNIGAGFAADDFAIMFTPYYEIKAAPLGLEVVSWNDDDTYAHQVNIRINVVPPEVLYREGNMLGILKRIEGLVFGKRGRS